VLEAHQRRHRELSDHPSAHYLRKLLAALEQVTWGTTPLTAELPEPLSERELEVLQLIAAGKSNKRIAQELFVTAGTYPQTGGTFLNDSLRRLKRSRVTRRAARRSKGEER
jgi:Bacterial regulatory proteins, luxR family